jgi:hypothetical protein
VKIAFQTARSRSLSLLLLGCVPDTGKQQSEIHLFLQRLIRKKGIAGAQDDVFIEIKPIRKISPGLKKCFLYQTVLCFP